MCKLLSIWLGYFVCLLSDGLVLPLHFQPEKYFHLRGLLGTYLVYPLSAMALQGGYHSPFP